MKIKPMSTRDALSCPQASRLVPPPAPPDPSGSLIGQTRDYSSTLTNRITPTLTLPPASQPCHTTGSQLPHTNPASPSHTASASFRDRTNSVKRKALDNLAIASAKSIRLTEALPSLVSQLSDNKLLVDKIGIEVSDEKFADCVDPSVVAILSKFSLAMTAQHSIISNVASELEGVKMLITDVQNSVNSLTSTSLDQSSFPPLSQPNFPLHSTGGVSAMSGNANAVSGIAKFNSRKPLKQLPLGSTEPWNTVGTRKNRKSRISVAVSQSELESESETPPPANRIRLTPP